MIINELIIGKPKLVPVKFKRQGNLFWHNHARLSEDKKGLIRQFYSFAIQWN